MRGFMNALTIRNLQKTYRNGKIALKGIDLNVAAGDFYALLGPNGAGKTTAIGIVCSLVNKSGGEVEIFGHNIDRELEAAKSCLGLVPQEINLNLWDTVGNIVANYCLSWKHCSRSLATSTGKSTRKVSLATAWTMHSHNHHMLS